MFKSVVVYKIQPGWDITLEQANAALEPARFKPCGATQDKSVGWVEPRGEAHAPLVESVAGQWILKLMIETKSVPGATVRQKAQEEADRIEATTGRKPGKKETKALREDALLALLPQAFARQGACWVWIDRENGWLVTDASSQGKLDEIVTALVRAFDGLVLTLVQTTVTPATAMTQWLLATNPDDIPGGFSVERDCELKSGDEEKSTVKFNRHNLANDEIKTHIAQGKLPTKLAMSWEGRISFQLTESMAIKKVSYLEGVFDGRPDEGESGFDTDVVLATGELRKLIPELLDALGGEMELGQRSREAEEAYGEMVAA